MTREEAIERFENIKANALVQKASGVSEYWQNEIDETIEAIDMAIEALSKPNYESDNEVRLAVTDRNKDKVVLWDAFGEVEYYPNGEINCVHCPHYHETEDDTGVHGHCEPQFYDEDDYWNGRVPTHGRLIDADALMEELSDIQPYNWTESEAEIQEEADYSLFKSLINSAPTVQADRPHGECLYRWNDVECSECGEFEKKKTNFCPNCGARMKGGDDE